MALTKRRSLLGGAASWVVALLALPFVLLAVHWPWVVRGLPPHGTDTFIFFPLVEAYRRWWAHGHLPLWSDAIFCGQPVALQSEPAILHPLRLALFAVAGDRGDGLWLYVHALVAAAGMFAYAHGITRSRFAATLAAYAAALGGPLAVQTTHPGLFAAIAWVPAQLHLTERILHGGRPFGAAAVFAVVTGLQCLSGHAQGPLLASYDVAAYALLRATVFRDVSAPAPWPRRRAAARVVLVGTAILAGAGLAAFQLVPLRDVLRQTNRAVGLAYDASAYGSVPPWSALLPIFPAFYGTDGPSDPTMFWLTSTGAEVGAWELHVYAGALIVLGATVGAWVGRREPLVRTHLVLVALWALYALGKFGPLYGFALHAPGLRYARLPARALALVFVSSVALAAVGWAAMARGGVALRRTWTRVAVATLLLAVVPWLASGAALRLGGDRLVARIAARTIEVRHRDDLPRRASRLRYARQRAREIRRQLLVATSPRATPALANLSLLAVAAVVGWGWLGASPPRRRAWDLAVVAMLAADLAWFHATFGARPPRVDDARAPPAWASRVDRAWRVLSLVDQDDLGREGPWDAYRDFVPPDMGAAWDLDTPDGVTSTGPAEFGAVFARMHREGESGPERIASVLRRVGTLRVASVGYVVTDAAWGRLPWPLAYDDGRVRVWHVPDALPRAFVTGLPDLESARWKTAFADPLPADESVRALATLHASATGTVVVRPQETPDVIELEVTTAAPGTVVRSTRALPGWHAHVDGHPVALRTVLGFFQGVRVAAGTHTVRLTYRPLSLRIGVRIAAVAAAAVLLLVALDLAELRRRARAPAR